MRGTGYSSYIVYLIDFYIIPVYLALSSYKPSILMDRDEQSYTHNTIGLNAYLLFIFGEEGQLLDPCLEVFGVSLFRLLLTNIYSSAVY